MTLRTNPATDDALARLAARDGISKHEAALRAIHAQAAELDHRDNVDAATSRALNQWGDVLDRLGTA